MKQLDKDLVLKLLKDLDNNVEIKNDKIEILLIGGALLMIYGIRDATYDIDVFRLTQINSASLAKGIIEVARRNNLPPDWINSDVENLGFNVEKLEKVHLYTLNNLVIYGVSNNTLLAMKLLAAFQRGTGGDEEDIQKLVRIMPEVKLDIIEKHFNEICPNAFFDRDLAEDIIKGSDYISNIFN